MARKWTQITNVQTGATTTIIGGGGSSEVISSLEAGKTVSQVVSAQVAKGAVITTSKQQQVKSLTWKAEQQRKGKFGGETELPKTLAKLERISGEAVTKRISVRGKEIPEPTPPLREVKIGEAVPKPAPFYVKAYRYVREAGGIAWGKRLPPDSRRWYRATAISGAIGLPMGALAPVVAPFVFAPVKILGYVGMGVMGAGLIRYGYERPKDIPKLAGVVLAGIAGYGMGATGIAPMLKPKPLALQVKATVAESLRMKKLRASVIKAKTAVKIKPLLRKAEWRKVDIEGAVLTVEGKYVKGIYRPTKLYIPKEVKIPAWKVGKITIAKPTTIFKYIPTKLKVPKVTYKGIIKTISPKEYIEIGAMYPPKALTVARGLRVFKLKGERAGWATAGEIYIKSFKKPIPTDALLLAKPKLPTAKLPTGLIIKPTKVTPRLEMEYPFAWLRREAVAKTLLDVGKVAVKIAIPPTKRLPVIPVIPKPVTIPKLKRVPAVTTVAITAVRERVITIPRVRVREIAGVITKRRAMVATITAVGIREALITRPALAVAVTPRVAIKEKLALRLAYAVSTVPAVPAVPIVPTVPIVPIGLPFPRFGFDVGWLRKRRIPARRVTAYVPAYPALIFRIYARRPTPPMIGRRYTGFELRRIPHGFTWAGIFGKRKIKLW